MLFTGVVAVCGGMVAAFAAPAIGPIVAGADVSKQAERITPPTSAPANGTSPTIGGCSVFPADNAWNERVDTLPLRAGSAATIARLGGKLHPDFGENPDYGIPYVVVPASQPGVPITFRDDGAAESDPGPYPIPADAPVEGGGVGDAHVLVLQQGACKLFELDEGVRSGAGWTASWGAEFDLGSNALRPDGWTSADAAGLPILPGLVRYDEVAAGEIDHAIRVTFSQTQRGYISPATHYASSHTDTDLPPMGLRMRLRGDYDLSGLHGQALVIATALKRYGFIVADNGSNWYFQGAPNPGWNDDDLNQLKSIPGSAFEVVDTGPTHTPG
ncbi:MAG: hypothetical protein JWM34_403 [Ilumatobacteraceae bacterium]|nr:hypothetical protein [Ilumatobacteraceae bacterium]